MNLDVQNWKEFLLSDHFDIVPGKYHYPEEYEDGTTPYYSASNENNGIGSYISLPPDFSGNCIVTGKVGCTAFYAPMPFCATSDVNVFKPNFDMSVEVGLFVARVINFSENYKWAYGRQCRVGNSKQIILKLPVSSDGSPDWDFMERYIKSLNHKPITTKNVGGCSYHTLGTENWKEFRVGDIVSIVNGKGLTIEEIEENPGDIPCIQGGEANNGSIGRISETYCKENEYVLMSGPCLTVARVGTAGCVNFQNDKCVIGDKCKALVLKHKASKYQYFFVFAVLSKMQYKYSYGRGLVSDKYLEEAIKLPVIANGDPDWQFMENYIKALPYGDRL